MQGSDPYNLSNKSSDIVFSAVTSQSTQKSDHSGTKSSTAISMYT